MARSAHPPDLRNYRTRFTAHAWAEEREIMDRKIPQSWQKWNTIVNMLLIMAALFTLLRAL